MAVKEKKRGRPSGTSGQLSADKIIVAAKSLMKDDAKIPSIRKLAGSLDVDAMAIYHYFANKNALLEAVTVSLIEAIYEPKGSEAWQTELTTLCNSYLSLLQAHPGLLQTFLGMTSTGPANVFVDRFYMAIAALNLTPEQVKDALDLLVDYLHGFALSLECGGAASGLTIVHAEGPLRFYIRVLEQHSV
ncbi:TetR/AcrR family transcriptional regulator [Photobacterium frigidiphilum]|uniref:TetR/AcrR family transcriptional regulator n=1 Tax=Photobacterium frigidiphilum TaxID=264736 RepID=UPI003D0EC304